MPSLRSPEGKRAYDEYLLTADTNGPCALCAKPTVTEFVHWRIIRNSFPYDLIAKTHDMLVTKRHAKESELTETELKELTEIKASPTLQEYDWIIEPTIKNKTIPAHMHLHVIVGKSFNSK